MRIVLFLFTLFCLNTDSDKNNYDLKNPCEFIISGTSTLHAWSMTCNTAQASARIETENQRLTNIFSLELNLLAENLKSKNKQMDKNAYKALKTKLFPEITFTFLKIENIKMENETALISANGSLSIAGIQNNVTIPVWAKIQDELISFEGETDLKLSEYSIDPPVFLGTVKTGNEIKVSFKVKFSKKGLQTTKTD